VFSDPVVAHPVEVTVGLLDLVPQHEELDVLRRVRAARQPDQVEDLLEDQEYQPQRHGTDHARLENR
jgi:hypothetical protein